MNFINFIILCFILLFICCFIEAWTGKSLQDDMEKRRKAGERRYDEWQKEVKRRRLINGDEWPW